MQAQGPQCRRQPRNDWPAVRAGKPTARVLRVSGGGQQRRPAGVLVGSVCRHVVTLLNRGDGPPEGLGVLGTVGCGAGGGGGGGWAGGMGWGGRRGVRGGWRSIRGRAAPQAPPYKAPSQFRAG